MNDDDMHQLGIKLVNIVNKISTDKFRVIVPGRENAIQVAEEMLELLEIKLRKNDPN